jgi:hypothetical protein
MFKKLFKKIGYVPDATHVSVKFLDDTVNSLNARIERLERENLQLRTEVAGKKEPVTKEYFDVNIGDPTPTDSDARKIYVGQSAGFFKSILEPKIKHMISVTHNMFEETNSDRDFDLILKGVVYSFREFLKWGESMVNEQMSYQTENLPEDSSISEEVKTLQESLKEQ